MFDLLTIEEDREAAAMGWSLNYVYHAEAKRWNAQVFPLAFVKPFECAESMAAHVVGMARMGHPLSIKALRFVAAPVIREEKK